jgi:ADP-ribose pyrophosphatase YjhB (NUDIX family)
MKPSAKPVHWAVAVYVLVRNSAGHVLLLRRSNSNRHFRGLWELPGGKPVCHEQIDTTALFEVGDESGLYVELTGVAGAVDGSVPGVRVAMLILEGRPRKSKITLSVEHDDFRWLPLAKVKSLKLRPGFAEFFAGYSPRLRRQPKKT